MQTEESVRIILREIRDNIASVAGGTQYDEGDTSATFAGNIAMAEGPSNTATPLQVDASKNLQVDIAADSVGIGGGTQYATNAAYADGNTGTLALTIRDDTLTTLTEADGDYSGLRVDSTGALWVKHSGNITADLGATDNAVLDAIQAATEATQTAVEGTLTVSGTVTANLGATDNAVLDAIQAAVDNVFGAGAPSVDSYNDADISASANTANQVLVSSAASKQIWVYGIQFTVGTGDGTVSFQDEDDSAITGVMPFAQNSGMALAPSGNFAQPLWKLGTNKDLEVDTVTCDIKGSIQYAIVDVS